MPASQSNGSLAHWAAGSLVHSPTWIPAQPPSSPLTKKTAPARAPFCERCSSLDSRSGRGDGLRLGRESDAREYRAKRQVQPDVVAAERHESEPVGGDEAESGEHEIQHAGDLRVLLRAGPRARSRET